MPPLIWLIEDRADVADSLIYTLETEGFNVCWFSHRQPALDALKQQTPQLIIVHTALPDGCGIDLGRVLQARHPALPLLFLADNGEQLTQISAEAPPHSNAIAAPFSAREVCARLRTLLQHPDKTRARATRLECYGDFTLNEARHCAHYCGHALQLTRAEYVLLKTLLQNQGKVLNRRQLTDLLPPLNEKSGERCIDHHLKMLRAKLQRITPRAIPLKTHHGVGFSIE
ncbi:winged helix-turn-helix domain-containing protein [Edwardsiella hoshinae]|uniref:Transcriptional regulatory protein CreB n=1 Tax=Edwardsiella hoshinae TaxID=93378 RepID=A0A376DLD2_9GAMM|nr:winged helix-turn-helix domain-containing protein [Edwardsiella hoshinae]QPR29315.1 winged helix-turn-helix domain-containing protein [Edwardsiella hoshinae]STC90785.1 Transcriptional regulatory protein CreB [Edwardsiella hoshinae]